VSTTGQLSAAATNQQGNADDHHDCADKDPERHDEISDEAKGDECNEPREPVTCGEAAFHGSAIDREAAIS
jgi:hypothetical protein